MTVPGTCSASRVALSLPAVVLPSPVPESHFYSLLPLTCMRWELVFRVFCGRHRQESGRDPHLSGKAGWGRGG